MPTLTARHHAQAPDYRISIAGQAITPRLRPRLQTLAIRQARGEEADELTLTLEDADTRLQLPRTGVTVQVELGWQGQGVATIGEFIVDEVEHSGAPDQVHIRGRSADLRAALPVPRTHSYDNTTLGAIIETIAGRHQLTPTIAPSLGARAIAHIDQTDESDANFLTRLGERYDAIATIKQAHLLFLPAGQAQTASGQAMPQLAISRASGDSHRYRTTDRERYTGVIAYYRDTAAAERQRVTAGNTETRPKTLRDTYPTQAEAQDAANSAWRSLQRSSRALELALARGRPTLAPETRITVHGFKAEIDAIDWLAVEVEHRLGPDGYTNTLKLEQK